VQETGTYFAKDAIHNIPTWFSYRKLQHYPIIATVGASEADILAGFDQRAARDYLSAIVISSLILLFSILVCIVLLQRKRNLDLVKESEIKYRSIFESSRDAILLVQPDGQIIAVNPAASTIFKMDVTQLCLKTIWDLADASDPGTQLFIHQQRICEDSKGELRFLRSNGSSFFGETASAVHKDVSGRERCIVIIRDITERRRMGEKLMAEQKRYQRSLTEQVIVAQEREREVIGRELHDNVNQVLTTVKLYLEMAMTNTDLREQILPKSIHYVMESINEIRNLSRDLSAPTLGTKSLVDSISALVEMIRSSSGLRIVFQHDYYHPQLTKDQTLAIYRIVQEQLNNVIKHA
jgi:PAS domain S-box-containing protein